MWTERFWPKVAVAGPDECWEWTASVGGPGYGQFWLGDTMFGAHRIVHALMTGSVTDEFVCHSCDNRRCVNPAHLWSGTAAENNADMAGKGRWRGGTCHGMKHKLAKLTDEEVLEIRRLGGTMKQRDIADRYGVSQRLVWSILHGRAWPHLTVAS